MHTYIYTRIKRHTHIWKETYTYVKKDLSMNKRPVNIWKETHMYLTNKETYTYLKRDPYTFGKRPIYIWPMLVNCIWVPTTITWLGTRKGLYDTYRETHAYLKETYICLKRDLYIYTWNKTKETCIYYKCKRSPIHHFDMIGDMETEETFKYIWKETNTNI